MAAPLHLVPSSQVDPPADAPPARRSRSALLLADPPSHRIFLRWVGGLVLVAVAAVFLPWRQSVRATGTVTALRPQDRPQTVNTVIAGRIERWAVAEGEFVRRGALLAEIGEVKDAYLDPAVLARTGEQLRGKQASVAAKRDKARALGDQIVALETGRTLSLRKAENDIARATLDVRIDSAAVVAARLDSTIAVRQLGAQQRLYADGLKSLVELETARARVQQSEAKLLGARSELAKSETGLLQARIAVSSVGADYADKVAKARADRSSTLADVGEGEAEVSKVATQYSSYEIRRALYRIHAPQDGQVVRAARGGVGEILKEGDPVVTLQPARPALAAELYVSGTDVPLLATGRGVRLQFDGWPALQFSGWPSVAVGTFGGIVRVVDPVASAGGSYRVLVTPDPGDERWPAQIRMGSGVVGWALLDEVPIWFELWRRLNGFPPSMAAPPGAAAATGAKKGA